MSREAHRNTAARISFCLTVATLVTVAAALWVATRELVKIQEALSQAQATASKALQIACEARGSAASAKWVASSAENFATSAVIQVETLRGQVYALAMNDIHAHHDVICVAYGTLGLPIVSTHNERKHCAAVTHLCLGEI